MSIDDRAFHRFEKFQRKKMDSWIEQHRPDQVFRTFPEDKILEEKQAVNYLTRETKLPEDTVVRSTSELVKNKKLISVNDLSGRRHYRKSWV